MPLHWRATCDGTAKSLWCSLAGLCSGFASKLVGLGEPAMPICRSKATFGLDFCRLCRAGMGSAHTTSLLRCVQSAVVLGSLCTVSSRVVLRTWAQTFCLLMPLHRRWVNVATHELVEGWMGGRCRACPLYSSAPSSLPAYMVQPGHRCLRAVVCPLFLRERWSGFRRGAVPTVVDVRS